MNEHSVIGLDIAKSVFQVHSVDTTTGQIVRTKLRRKQVLEFFAKQPPQRVALEACGSAHWWARQLASLGHRVTLLPPRLVRPFVLRNKTDAADAQAIWTAAQQPGIKVVAVKSPLQQSILALHRIRAQLLKMRIMQSNAVRGLLYEFGIILPQSDRAMSQQLPAQWAALEREVPAFLMESLREQWQRVCEFSRQLAAIDRRLEHIRKQDPHCEAVSSIPGIGVLTATAAVAAMGDPRTFRSGREFAAWLGLVPRQSGTGGRVRQLGISKRGDAYLRTLLMHAARSIIIRRPSWAWLTEILKRRPFNVVVAALANKLARTIWAVLAHGRPYEPMFLHSEPA
jgi:transposase